MTDQRTIHPSATFKTALVQMEPIHLNKEANLEKMCGYISEAASMGAKLIVFPELVLTGYVLPYTPDEKRRFYDASESIPGPASNRIGELCEKRGVYSVFGMPERGSNVLGPVMQNVSVLTGPRGLIGVHRKLHLPGGEKLYFQPGEDIVAFDTELGRIALLVCYDFWFPESSRIAGIKGAEIIIDIANWPSFDTETWFAMGPGVAASNVLWFVQVNRVGGEDHWPGFGGSQIIGPSGAAHTKAPNTEGITYGEIDVSKVSERRLITPVWFDRRPEIYGEIAQITNRSCK